MSSSDGGCHGLRACPALHRAEGPSPAGHGLFAWDLTGGVPVEKPRQLWGLPRGGPGPSLASERRTLGRGGLGWGERCSRQRKQHLGESVRKVSWPPPCRSEERCGGRGGAWSAVGWGEGARLEWHPPAGGRVLMTPLCLPWGEARGGRPDLRPENRSRAASLAGFQRQRALARRPRRRPSGSWRDTRPHASSGRRSSCRAERTPLPGAAGSLLVQHPRGS